uniref:Delta-conotoxin Am2766 n=1 Tax=Conus amadis TaxID=198732 RepID=O166_CONAA|nr:RecName: Full=Delta-conotoxin Am2766; Short=Am 2766; Short=Delta-Am2766 [Conus amadis]
CKQAGESCDIFSQNCCVGTCAFICIE